MAASICDCVTFPNRNVKVRERTCQESKMDVEQKIIQYRKYLERNPDEKKVSMLQQLPTYKPHAQFTLFRKCAN